MGSEIFFREAQREDVKEIVALLADDELGAQREQFEDPLPESYYRAFDAIDSDPKNVLVVGDDDGRVVGVLQLTIIPGLTYRGGSRALIEAVRVHADRRSAGIGRKLFVHAIELARVAGCVMVQLTTAKSRVDAQRFYESLGFNASHDGMKKFLTTKR